MDPRHYTNKLYDLAGEGAIGWQMLARACLEYMSEDDVKDMAIREGLLDDEDETEDA